MSTGIYCIENLVNGKKYVGQALDIERRWITHKSYLRGNYHENNHLQSAWNQYGEDAFDFSVLEYCDKENLTEMEQYYITEFDTLNRENGYNKKEAGIHGKCSEETKNNLSESHKGKILSEKSRKKLSESLKGNSNAKGNTNMLGKKHSEEAKKKMSESLKGKTKGKPKSEETRKKMSESAKGKPKSEETKKKISDAKKLYWAKRREGKE